MGENADEYAIFLYDPSFVTDTQRLADAGFFYSLVGLPYTASLLDWINLWTAYPVGVAETMFSAIVDGYQQYIVQNSAGFFSANIGMMMDALRAQNGRDEGTLFRFFYANPNSGAMDVFPLIGAPHTAELNYVWGYHIMGRNFLTDNIVLVPGTFTYTDAEMDMGLTMHKFWSSFIATGSPNANGDGVVTWSPITPTEKHTMIFQSAIPGGAALDPCALFTSCWAEPTADFRAAIQTFYASGFATTGNGADTCTTPVVGYSHTGSYQFAANCSITVSTYPGSLPCCRRRDRSLLFGSPTNAACRAC